MFAPELVDSLATERPITVDQTNYSVVVGERVVVKWLRPPVTGEHPAVRLMTHLREVGFVEMPAFFGALVEGTATAAIVTGFIKGSQDGWQWYVDELTDAASIGDLTAPLESAVQIGALTGRLHRALATPSTIIPEPLQEGSLSEEVARGIELLDEAGDEPVVAVRANDIQMFLDNVTDPEDHWAQPIHGDLHVGQILRAAITNTSSDGNANTHSNTHSNTHPNTHSNSMAMFVNDFDGSPVDGPDERLRPRSRLIDLASILQSIDHVGRIVAKRRPDLERIVDVFISDASTAALSAYRQAFGSDERIDLAALLTLSIIQELHEFVYAQRSLPGWRYVPEAALAALLPADASCDDGISVCFASRERTTRAL